MNDSGFDATIREGAKSQFDVLSDGKLVFSKQALRRWPQDGEVRSLLSSR